jgi:cytochrome b561
MNQDFVSSRSAPAGQSYALPLRWLHWLSAAVILWAIISGFWAGSLPESEASRQAIAGFNVALTTLFIPVFALRIYVRFTRPVPGPIWSSKLHIAMARYAHMGLYLLVSFILLTGVLAVDHPADVFGVLTLQPLAIAQAVRDQVIAVHAMACRALGGLVFLHILAVIWHQRSGRNVMARMRVP